MISTHMRFEFRRKVNQERFTPGARFENSEFGVLDADSPEQAQQAVEQWIDDYADQKKKESEEIKRNNMTPEEKFAAELDDTAAAQPPIQAARYSLMAPRVAAAQARFETITAKKTKKKQV